MCWTSFAIGLVVFGLAASLSAAELKPGDAAPDFTLKGSDDKTHKLADYRGKAVVIAWFPRAFTPGCTKQCASFAKEGKPLKQFEVVYFTASTDTPEKNKEFAKSVGADYPILSDPSGETAKAFGVSDGNKPASRWTFYIGPEGKILFIDKGVSPATHAADVAAKLKELGVAAKKSG